MTPIGELTPEQKAKLQGIATQVKGSYATLPVEDVLNRIHFLTNRPYDGCINGLRLMLEHKLITAQFAEGLERLERLERAVVKAMPIIVAMDAQVVRATEMLSDGPKDDEDETQPSTERKQIDLSHVNANF